MATGIVSIDVRLVSIFLFYNLASDAGLIYSFLNFIRNRIATLLYAYLEITALAFAWIERMLYSPKQTLDVAKALSLLDSTLVMLKAAGIQELVYEDFYDVLISLIRQIVVPEPDGSTLTPEILLEAFQDAEGMHQLPGSVICG